MEAVPDDLLRHDLSTFPQENPAVLAKQAAVNAAAEKERKQQEAAEARERKAEEAKVKKSLAMPTGKERATTQTLDVRKRELIAHKIRLYFKLLGHKLTTKEPKTLPKTDEELLELLAMVETELQSKGGIEGASKLMIGTAFALEQVNAQFNPFGLMLSGPAASLSSSVAANRKEWDELVTEFAISNAEWFVGKVLIAYVLYYSYPLCALSFQSRLQTCVWCRPPQWQSYANCAGAPVKPSWHP
jgi:hypothetical protein